MQIHLPYSNDSGTAFTIEVDKRQYLITARHVVSGIKAHDKVELKVSSEWVLCPVTVIDSDTNADITVLAAPAQLTTAYEVNPTLVGSVLAQDAFFLGFPYGLYIPMTNFNIAFVKKGIISGFLTDSNGIQLAFLDGHNNPGFSGGPIVFKNVGNGVWHIGGVVSGYKWTPGEVVGDPKSYVKENTGIIVVTSIDVAVKAIKANPIGALVKW
ncbi:MAG TPA: serine protease [Candidatus Saccharimonadales bacterium]|nr:serine protease [Candidatus Saccharimonadales bacterium]